MGRSIGMTGAMLTVLTHLSPDGAWGLPSYSTHNGTLASRPMGVEVIEWVEI